MKYKLLYFSFIHLGYQIQSKNEQETKLTLGLVPLLVVKCKEGV